MARIILGSYMVRYPLGGMMSWVLQYLIGFQRLGHDIYFVEKSGYANSCYNPVAQDMSDDCSYGVETVRNLLARFGLGDRFCFVDAANHYHGLSRNSINRLFKSADLFMDMGTHGAWFSEATNAKLRVLIDGEPGFTQMKMVNRSVAGEPPSEYDHYYTVGGNIGTKGCTVPIVDRQWRVIFHPVVCDLFSGNRSNPRDPFTTVMNWQSHEPIQFNGKIYGQKDVEFLKFIDLPCRTAIPLEIAVSGKNVPTHKLEAFGWRVRSAHEITLSFDSFRNYLYRSRGEFSVCKNVFVATRSGWFSDRSAAYLASSKPVVMQDTGFSEHLPCGRGLFAVRTVEEAAAAIDDISGDYERHAKSARDLASEYFDAKKTLGRFLFEIGL